METPPFISPPVRKKRKTFVALLFIVLFPLMIAGWLFYTYIMPHYPNESELIQNFHAHQATYEKLRDMFQADGHVNRITSYGVVLTNSVSAHFAIKPQEAGFPIDRYNEYLALFKQAGVLAASRRELEGSSDPAFFVWAWGAIDTFRHIAICWKDQEPTNQVASLYQRRQSGEKRPGVYRHIKGHWYLWMGL